jgi:hypothetical protein
MTGGSGKRLSAEMHLPTGSRAPSATVGPPQVTTGGEIAIWSASWNALVTIPAGSATHTITARQIGGPEPNEVSVTVNVGSGVRNAQLSGTCTGKSAMTLTSPLGNPAFGLQFTAPSEVVITSFPSEVAFGADLTEGLTLSVIMTLTSSGKGTFDTTTGSIAIPDVVFAVTATITGSFAGGLYPVNVPGEPGGSPATLTTTLTTGSTNTPESPPVFADTGQALLPGGQVLLVGDGTYTNSSGQPAPLFGMFSDAGIALAGVLDFAAT